MSLTKMAEGIFIETISSEGLHNLYRFRIYLNSANPEYDRKGIEEIASLSASYELSEIKRDGYQAYVNCEIRLQTKLYFLDLLKSRSTKETEVRFPADTWYEAHEPGGIRLEDFECF